MKVAVFSTKPYDREYLNKFNADGKNQVTYFEASLNSDTTNLVLPLHQGFFTKEALDQIASTTLQNLSDFENGLPLLNEVKNN